MNIFWVSPGKIEPQPLRELEAMLGRNDGFVWVDIPECNKQATQVLSKVFCFHPLAIRDCTEPGRMPKIHAYSDHVFLVLHSPELKGSGEVHRFELNQFIGRRFLVTVHENSDPKIPLEHALRETRLVLERLQAGRLNPSSPGELSYSIVSAMTRHMEGQVAALAKRVAELERKVMRGQLRDPEGVLEEIFLLRHEFLTLRTIAAENREMYIRMASLSRYVPPEDEPYIADVQNQLERIQALCDEEKKFLQGVLDFYQTRSTSRIQSAMQRMAFITALALPVTAVASIYGMNVIVNSHTDPIQLFFSFLLMGGLIAGMLWWSKHEGWW